MKRHLFIVIVLFVIGYSCSKSAKNEDEKGSQVYVIKEYHSNGQVKTEINAVGEFREGPTRNYDRYGRLLSEVNYIHNVREGIAKNYYANSGKLHSSLIYVNGVKNGDEIMYYENGQIYRISPYINGEITGTQKLFYENGQLMAEIPYKMGYPGEGLKEFKEDGTLIKDYPRLVIRQENHLRDANMILLVISLSNNFTDVKFYKGPLEDGKYLHKSLFLLATQNGVTQINYNIQPGSMLSEVVVVTSNYKTQFKNPYIIHKSITLKIFNPN